MSAKGNVLVVRRATKRGGGLEILGVFEKANIRERFPMFRTVSAVAMARFLVHFAEMLDKI